MDQGRSSNQESDPGNKNRPHQETAGKPRKYNEDNKTVRAKERRRHKLFMEMLSMYLKYKKYGVRE